MYFVNMEQIEDRLQFLPLISNACREAAERWNAADPLVVLAEERALHLAIESVTDIGSLMIDGFIMRDASSYEDIVDILAGEGVFSAGLAARLQELVRLRRPLVQDYMKLPRTSLNPMTADVPEMLEAFASGVRAFSQKELNPE